MSHTTIYEPFTLQDSTTVTTPSQSTTAANICKLYEGHNQVHDTKGRRPVINTPTLENHLSFHRHRKQVKFPLLAVYEQRPQLQQTREGSSRQ